MRKNQIIWRISSVFKIFIIVLFVYSCSSDSGDESPEEEKEEVVIPPVVIPTPIATNDTAETNEDTFVDIDVLANDSDVQTTGTLTITTAPTNGIVEVNDGGTALNPSDDTVTYTPNTDYDGSDSFTYQICNSATPVSCSSATVAITVNDVINPDPISTIPPSENFDLTTWKISIPTDEDNSGTADEIKENELSSGYINEDYFYTAEDGGMVFKCFVDGFKTSADTSYTRTELREMLRAGNTSINTTGISENNWVFGSAPQSDIDNSGGYDGEMTATLAVNHVTTTGDSGQIGRVIVGQIHANDDEPIRIYYRKLPNNNLGSIYFAHEANEDVIDEETYYEMIGSRSDSASNPMDGIALGEKFSYTIKIEGNTMWVTISRDGKVDIMQQVDMSNSGYDVGGQYMYFKAGVYNQNNTGDATDYVKATFYSLSATHSD